MPAYRYLFEVRRVAEAPSASALKLPEKYAPPTGWEVVPRFEAVQLVAYLNSLKSETGLFDAPLPMMATNAPAAVATNAPGVGTNAPVGAERKHE